VREREGVRERRRRLRKREEWGGWGGVGSVSINVWVCTIHE